MRFGSARTLALATVTAADRIGAVGAFAGNACEDRAAGGEVLPEDLHLGDGILQALEIGGEQRVGFVRQAVDHPLAVALRHDHPELLHVGQLLGGLDLRFPQDFLEVADTQGAGAQQVEDAQALRVAEAFIDLDRVHGGYILLRAYPVNGIYWGFQDTVLRSDCRGGLECGCHGSTALLMEGPVVLVAAARNAECGWY